MTYFGRQTQDVWNEIVASELYSCCNAVSTDFGQGADTFGYLARRVQAIITQHPGGTL